MGKQRYRRTPKNYDGVEKTTHTMQEILPYVLKKVGRVYEEGGDQVLRAWPDAIGSQLAPMTRAVKFYDGVLTVNVRNNTLYSLLVQGDKEAILRKLRDQVPHAKITGLYFRIG